MAKGSVRKKGNKWYYRFYVENESGKQVQKECVGTESKSETEAMLRKAMEDYEAKKFIAMHQAKPKGFQRWGCTVTIRSLGMTPRRRPSMISSVVWKVKPLAVHSS